MVGRVHPFTEAFVAAVGATAPPHAPLVIPWPAPGNPAGFISFDRFAPWLSFVSSLSLRDGIPLIVVAKFARAQKLMLLGWIDADLIKAAELVGLSTLELALTDRYGPRAAAKYGNDSFGHLLKYMVHHDDLTDAKIEMNQRCGGGSVVPLLTGDRKPSLAEIRNAAAHGYPFDGFLWAGMLELIRDLIEYAYRDFVPDQV